MIREDFIHPLKTLLQVLEASRVRPDSHKEEALALVVRLMVDGEGHMRRLQHELQRLQDLQRLLYAVRGELERQLKTPGGFSDA